MYVGGLFTYYRLVSNHSPFSIHHSLQSCYLILVLAKNFCRWPYNTISKP
jgi:hypothetical protein